MDNLCMVILFQMFSKDQYSFTNFKIGFKEKLYKYLKIEGIKESDKKEKKKGKTEERKMMTEKRKKGK